MSKTLKDAKEEREGRKGLPPRRDRRKPPPKEKGGMKSIREMLEEEDGDASTD